MWTSTLCFLATIASFAVQQGEGLKCYVCSTDSDPSCADPFNPDVPHRYLTDCDFSRSSTPWLSIQPSCKKVIQTSRVPDGRGVSVVERSCAWFNRDEDPCQRKHMKYNHNLDHCSTCNDDGCNGAATNYLATVALLGSLLIAKYFA